MANPIDDEPHIAKEYQFGATQVYIADNYCKDKTPKQAQEILDRIATNALRHLNAYANQGVM